MTPAVLIVDDHDANLRLYRAILKDAGAELVFARTGEQALSLCKLRPYAMILMDVHLSGMSGFDVARRLREICGREAAPIVFVSAVYTHEADAFRGYDLGAVDYILSPVVPQILRSKVAAFVRLERLRSEAQAHGKAMERAYRELRIAHTELEHFSYSASHDLRTPLAHIVSFVELLRRHAGAQLDARANGYLGQVVDATSRMTRLIDDLLSLARTSRAEVRAEVIDLSTMACEVMQQLSQGEPQRVVQCAVAGDLRAHGDPRLLRSALANLISNAWKYSEGSGAARIEVGRLDQQRDGEPVFFVRDNGAGFDRQAAGERLFQPFQRFHPEAAFAGTGVGLAIVQRVVEKHGGEVWAESAPGLGASFYFTLPAVGDGLRQPAASNEESTA